MYLRECAENPSLQNLVISKELNIFAQWKCIQVWVMQAHVRKLQHSKPVLECVCVRAISLHVLLLVGPGICLLVFLLQEKQVY